MPMLAEKLHEPKRRKQGFQRLSVESALPFVHYFNPNLGKLNLNILLKGRL